MMHEREKTDSVIVAGKPTNKTALAVAEPVEPRTRTERNAGRQSTHRTRGRARVSQALDRVRKASKQSKKERFTALLHHIVGNWVTGNWGQYIFNRRSGSRRPKAMARTARPAGEDDARVTAAMSSHEGLGKILVRDVKPRKPGRPARRQG